MQKAFPFPPRSPRSHSIAVNAAIEKIRSLGATIQDPADPPSINDYLYSNNETIVLQNDFKVDLGNYLANLISSPVRSLQDVINFNDANAAIEMPAGECCQETLVASFGTPGINSTEYLAARAADMMIGATNGIDAVLDQYGLDALVLPSEGFATGERSGLVMSCEFVTDSARLSYQDCPPLSVCLIPRLLPLSLADHHVPGYPIVTMPLSVLNGTGQPFGLSFIGRKWSEPTLISLMAAFEANFPPRAVPSQLQ